MEHDGTERWWQRAVIYEIAVVSFQDSDGDGWGDLAGLLKRIDYLQWLGIDAVWLTPIQKSPMRDFGYDIADYCDIDPTFGSLADFDQLVTALHTAGIRLILDLVPNHTSSDHPWFNESRSSRTNAKADWYLWADAGANGGPPNNWQSRFSGSAWEWSPERQQYYCHTFLVEQPDLNWRNEEVRQAVGEVMRFWLDRGVDGFRLDASAVLIKDDLLRDNPPNPDAGESAPPTQRQTPVFTDDRPEAMNCIETIRQVLESYDHRLLCGEVQGKTDRIGHFYGSSDRPRLHLPLNFALLDTAWDALSIQATIDAYYNALPEGAWPVWVIGGHDKRRIASKIGKDQARIIAMLLLTLRGTPFFYMGDELGRERSRIPHSRVRDPFEKLVPGFGLGRDAERTPMRWDDGPNGGFTSGAAWLPIDEGAPAVERLMKDEHSLLTLYRNLVALRRHQPILTDGEYRPRRARDDVISFDRVLEGSAIAVGLNISMEPRRWDCKCDGKLLRTTYLDRADEWVGGSILLRPNEGVLLAYGATKVG